jgi:DNA replication and repair protein RecF
MIRSVWVKGYRNLSETVLPLPTGQPLVIWGDNNQGKTNLLDAIYFAANGQTTLKAADHELVQLGQEKAQVGLLFSNSRGENHRLYVQVTPEGEKRVVLDQRIVRRRGDAFSSVMVDYWSADLIRLFQDAPEQRRREVDRFGVHTQPGYAQLLQVYERTLRHKVEVLKGSTFSGLELWNKKLVSLSVQIVEARRKALALLESELKKWLPQIRPSLNGQIQIRYTAKHVGVEDYEMNLVQALAHHSEAEKSRKQALVGPHRDDFDIVMDNKPLFTMGSRGINRTVAIAFEWVQFFLRTQQKPRPTLLLLDDVCAEIDATGKRQLLSFFESQVPLVYASTASDRAYFSNAVMERQMREGCLVE